VPRPLFFFPGFAVSVALAFTMASAALTQGQSANTKITVISSAFPSGGKIPDQFTCKGANINPPLEFDGIPAGAKSLALIVSDPDAPNGNFTHWLVWNIDPATKQIREKSVPSSAAQGTNDFGKIGYGGPCPPSGTHRYIFNIVALDRKLDIRNGARRHEFDKAIAGHTLARGELMARYSK
jgi:Raf kinase inhibitor-like YbhB/YbcL family protein